MECILGNVSGKASDSSDEESQELLGEGRGDNIGNEKNDSNTEHLFGVVKRKRKKVIELDNHSSNSELFAFEDIAPKKKVKKEVLKKKEEKKPTKKKDCSFTLDKEKKERLKLLEEVKRDLEGKTVSQPKTTTNQDDNFMVMLLQQQAKQREEDKAARDHQLNLAHMDMD
eukprot:2920671-Ditylum_brightwellii.AAC.1